MLFSYFGLVNLLVLGAFPKLRNAIHRLQKLTNATQSINTNLMKRRSEVKSLFSSQAQRASFRFILAIACWLFMERRKNVQIASAV